MRTVGQRMCGFALTITWAAVERTGVMDTAPAASPPGFPRDEVKEPARLLRPAPLFLLSLRAVGAPVPTRETVSILCLPHSHLTHQ